MIFLKRILEKFTLIFGMANLLPEDTGIRGVVLLVSPGTVAGKKLRHGPRIKVYSEKTKKSVSVTISNPPRVLGKLPASTEKDVLAFIELNFELLMKLWDEKIGGKQFMLNVKAIR